MRFCIAIPQFDYEEFDADGLRAFLTRAEELGFEGAWTLEQTIGEAPLLAPLELLSFCAGCTERLRLGVAVLVTSLHEPLQLASAVTTVDRISRGRLDVAGQAEVADDLGPPATGRRTGGDVGRRHDGAAAGPEGVHPGVGGRARGRRHR